MQVRRIAAFVAVYLLWGGSYLAVREVVRVIPPTLAAGTRYTLAAFILIPWSLARGTGRLTSVQLLNTLWTGAMLLTFGYGIVFWAETRLSSWIVAVLISTTFLWTYLGECLVLRQRRMSTPGVLAIITGLFGVLLLVGGTLGRDRISLVACIAVLLTLLPGRPRRWRSRRSRCPHLHCRLQAFS